MVARWLSFFFKLIYLSAVLLSNYRTAMLCVCVTPTSSYAASKQFEAFEEGFGANIKQAKYFSQQFGTWLKCTREVEDSLDRIQALQTQVQLLEQQVAQSVGVTGALSYVNSNTTKSQPVPPTTLYAYFNIDPSTLTAREQLKFLKRAQREELKKQRERIEALTILKTNLQAELEVWIGALAESDEISVFQEVQTQFLKVFKKEFKLLNRLTQELSESVTLMCASQYAGCSTTDLHFQLKKKEAVEDLTPLFQAVTKTLQSKPISELTPSQEAQLELCQDILLDTLSDLQEIQQDLKAFSQKAVRLTIIHLFGQPGASPVRWDFFRQLLQKAQLWLAECIRSFDGQSFSWSDAISLLIFPLLTLVGIKLLAWLLYAPIGEFEAREQASLGKITKDNVALSLERMMWTLVFSLPRPLLLAAFSYGFRNSNFVLFNSFGEALYPLFLPALLMQFCLRCSENKGLFVEYFRCSKAIAAKVSRILKPRIILSLSAVFCFNLWGNSLDYVTTLGRACLLVLALLILETCYAFYREDIMLYWEPNPFENKTPVSPLIWLSVMSVTCWMGERALSGYIQTAQIILQYLTVLVSLWCLTLLLYQLCFRWVFLNRRRLSFERAKLRRQEAEAIRTRTDESAKPIEQQLVELEEPVLDLETASSAVLKLCKSFLLTVFLGGSMVLLSVPNNALGLLNKPFPLPLPWLSPTLYRGMAAAVIGIITFHLNQQVGALLDASLFARSKVRVDSAESLKRLLRYGIIGGGIFWATAMLRWEWSNWSFAAIASFLGFGIRDIFASFFAGLIMMITQPFKVGHHVTFGEFSGTVKKINGLSTVLLDSKKREYFIPNKDVLVDRWFHDVNAELTFPITLHLGLTGNLPPEAVLSALSALLTTWAEEFNALNLTYQLHSVSKEEQTYELTFALENADSLSLLKADLYKRLAQLFKTGRVLLTEAM